MRGPDWLDRWPATGWLSTLLPLVGVPVFGWRVPDVLVVYWLELGHLVVLYPVLALFAAREPRPAERTVRPVRLPVPGLGRTGSLTPVEWLPPVHRRNVPYAAGLFAWSLGFWLLLSALLVALPAPEPLVIPPGLDFPRLGDYVAVVAGAVSGPTVVAGGCLGLGRVVVDGHRFLAGRRHEALSAPMVAELPARVLLFWFLLTPVATFGVPVATLPLADAVGTRTLTVLGVGIVVVSGKLVAESGIHRALSGRAVDGLARWFVPAEPGAR